jgi:hypothetical protein
MEANLNKRSWTQVRFDPWEGAGYCSVQNRESEILPNDVRLLVLGDSHYGIDDDERSDFTGHVVECFLKKGENPRFFGAVTSTLSGNRYGDMQKDKIRSVFNDIAFYNFVKESAGPIARSAPTRRAFTNSYAAFFEVLTALAPTHVWVCGRRLWNNMPYSKNMPEFPFIDLGTIEKCGKRAGIGEYLVGASKVRCLATGHPSGAFSWKDWRPLIVQFLHG